MLLLEGPRSVGKSTLLAELALAEEQTIYDLDQTQFRLLAQQNETALVDVAPPVLIDEYQRVPSLLDAIKARLNRETRPGMFVLAGSASYDSLPKGTQALTGRIRRLPVMPFTQTEIDGSDNHFIEHAFESDILHTAAPARTTRAEYVERVLRGGMPLAISARTAGRRPRPLAPGACAAVAGARCRGDPAHPSQGRPAAYSCSNHRPDVWAAQREQGRSGAGIVTRYGNRLHRTAGIAVLDQHAAGMGKHRVVAKRVSVESTCRRLGRRRASTTAERREAAAPRSVVDDGVRSSAGIVRGAGGDPADDLDEFTGLCRSLAHPR